MVVINQEFEIIPQEIITGAKSGEHAGQFMSPLKEISRSGKASLRNPIEMGTVWGLAPSSWNHTLSLSRSKLMREGIKKLPEHCHRPV